MMDLDLLSPKRKRSGRALSLKKSNSLLPHMTNSSDKVEPFLPHESDNEAVTESCATFLAIEPVLDEPRCQDNSPLKARRYSGPIMDSSDDNSKESTSSSAITSRYVKDANEEEKDLEKEFLSSPSSPFTHSQINTTFDSNSLILRCDDTTISSSLSPGSPQSASFMKEAATERKSSARIEESDWPVQKSTSDKSNQRREAKEFQYGNCGILRNIISSDYSPEVMIRKGSYGCDVRASSSSAGPHGTAFKRSNFTCPGSENLRHDQRTEDEWRSSFEGDDGESDEEEKSGHSSSCMTDRIKLKFSNQQLFENDNSMKSTNSRLSDEDDHQQMDSNMSSMALHVAKDCIHGKGRIRSRTIFDNELPSGEGIELRFLARRNRVGGNLLRNNPLISDDSTSFVDALATSGSSGGERNGAQYSSRTSFTATFRNPFDQMQNEDFGNNEDISPHDVSEGSDRGEWNASPAKFTRKTGGGYHLFSSLSSPSPDNQHTPPRSIIATAAASMGDLGTPVTEVGSPADIDMGTAYDPYAAGEDCEDDVGHDGMFGYRSNRHSAKHEEPFMEGSDRNSRSPDPTSHKYRSNLVKPVERNPPLVADSYGGRRRDDKSSSFADHADMYISNSTAFLQRHDNWKCNRYTCGSSSTDKELSHLDGIYQQNRGVFSSSSGDNSTIFNGVANVTSHAVASTSRPQPVQSAFNSCGPSNIVKSVCGGGVGGDCPSTPMRALPACPATPMRTPTWAAAERVATSYNNSDEERDRMLGERERSDGTEHHSLISRQNSLTTNKVLLSLSDTLDSTDVSYHRDFEQEGFLGSGNFADVYQAKERNGKSYAVKKIKRPFRSKKERHLLMGEVLIMEKLAGEQCEYIVPLVRAWQEEGYFFVQIGLAERGTLKDLLTDLAIKHSEPLDSTVWHILHDVTSGLQHIHKFGVVHLDVKPANLLISINGVIQIGDFGTAAHLGKGDDGHEGDGRYLAFEVLNSRDRYPSADIFSLGLTIYETCISCTPQYRDHVALGNSPLPSDGLQWHVLRDGDPPDPPGRNEALCALIRATLHPVAFERPSTHDILSLPDVCNAVLHRRSDVLCSAMAPKTDTQQLSRPQSFMGSMGIIDTSSNSSMQLLEAGCNSAALPIIYEGDRAITPTGANGGSTSFWLSPPVKKWDEKEKEKDGESLTAHSISSTMEYAPAVAYTTPVIGKFSDGVSSPVCPIKEENDSPFAASSSSSCLYDYSHWSSPTDSPPRIQCLPTVKPSRPGDAYFPPPRTNGRSERFPAGVEVPTGLTNPFVSTPICSKEGKAVKDSNGATHTRPTSSSAAKFSYAEIGCGFDVLPSSKDSIGDDSSFSPIGLAGYRPLPFSTPGNFQARNSSTSLIRAGMETVNSRGSSCRSSGKERLDD